MTRPLVDPVAMAAAVQEAKEALADMSARLTTVTGQVEAARPGFQGPAGDAFEAAWGLSPQDGLQGKMRTILREFENMASIVGVGARRHDAAERDSAGSIARAGQTASPGLVFSTLTPGSASHG